MRILVSEPVAPAGIKILESAGQVDVRLGMKPGELLAAIGDYDAILVRSETKVTREVIDAGKRLQVIGRAGVGVDNIDLDAATQKGIIVVNAPAANTVAAAEHTIGLMFALARHIPHAHMHLKGGQWLRHKFVGTELRNKTLGIIGLGNVGSEVARRVQALQMRVLGFDPFVSATHAANLRVELASMETLLKESDFLTLHLPLTPSSRNLLGAKELAMVKPNVRIINCARGGLIDEQALCQAIDEGRVAGAAIDVFEHEPPVDCPLMKNDKIIVTPHLGASTEEAQIGVSVDAAEQIVDALKGKTPRYAVNAPLIPAETLSMLAPYADVAMALGRLAAQLVEGQVESVDIIYEGELSNHDVRPLKAATLRGLLEETSEERINVVNASLIAQRRGIRVGEHTNPDCDNYPSLITITLGSSKGQTTVSGTVLRGQSHVIRVNEYWTDLVPKGGYFLFSDHRDRPGLIGAVGQITGSADINISSMLLARLEPRGKALMILELDEPLREEHIRELLALPDVYTAKVVKL